MEQNQDTLLNSKLFKAAFTAKENRKALEYLLETILLQPKGSLKDKTTIIELDDEYHRNNILIDIGDRIIDIETHLCLEEKDIDDSINYIISFLLKNMDDKTFCKDVIQIHITGKTNVNIGYGLMNYCQLDSAMYPELELINSRIGIIFVRTDKLRSRY